MQLKPCLCPAVSLVQLLLSHCLRKGTKITHSHTCQWIKHSKPIQNLYGFHIFFSEREQSVEFGLNVMFVVQFFSPEFMQDQQSVNHLPGWGFGVPFRWMMSNFSCLSFCCWRLSWTPTQSWGSSSVINTSSSKMGNGSGRGTAMCFNEKTIRKEKWNERTTTRCCKGSC